MICSVDEMKVFFREGIPNENKRTTGMEDGHNTDAISAEGISSPMPKEEQGNFCLLLAKAIK